MNQSEPSLLTALQAKMKWASKRQNLISQNIANADTPGYAPRDLKKLDFKSVLKATRNNQASLNTTDSKHFALIKPEGEFKAEEMRSQEAALNGNRVDLESESIKMAVNKDEYTMASTIYRKYNDMLKMAVRPTGQ